MDKDITTFAQTTFRNQFQKFGIKTDDRRRHMYLIGKTGMGKSTILENMIIEDIRAGRGVAVVDPHGDLAEKIIEYIPTNRINDVIYFNPADAEYPIAFNIVEQVDADARHLVASGLIGVFKKLWADSWGPRLEYILRNTILAILDYPGATLLAVIRMLSDKPFRKKIIDSIQDPVDKSFWVNEFAGYADKFASEAVSPIQNKVGQFLSTALIRNIIGQTTSSINVRNIMDEKKILIMNLSKGRIGEDNSALLGAMMITKIQLAAMSRVNIPQDQRKDFYLYIDEFQNFTTDAFVNILSEARKYHLNLIMAHQYIEQLGEVVKPAVFGNVGTLVVFRVGAADAEELLPEFTPVFTEEDILNLPKYEFYLKLMIDGIASDPFSAQGLAPLSEDEKTNNIDKVIKLTREQYCKKREVVEDKIMRWHGGESGIRDQGLGIRNQELGIRNQKTAIKQQITDNRQQIINKLETNSKQLSENSKNQQQPINNHQNNTIFKFQAVCSHCGNTTKLPFQPDGVRPVFCKECLYKLKKQKQEEFEQRKQIKKQELTTQQKQQQTNQASNKPIINKQNALSLAEAITKEPIKFKNAKNPVNQVFNKGEQSLNEDEEVIL